MLLKFHKFLGDQLTAFKYLWLCSTNTLVLLKRVIFIGFKASLTISELKNLYFNESRNELINANYQPQFVLPFYLVLCFIIF